MLNYKWLISRIHYLMAIVPTLSFRKILNIIICLISYIFKTKTSGKAPIILAINITYRCNYSCIMCQKSSVQKNVYTDNPKDLNFNEIEKLLRENSKYISIVRLSGGEPLYYEAFIRLIDLLDQLKMKYALLTNGSLLTSEISKKLLKNCIEISFSIDSAESEKYSEIREQGNLDIVSHNINYLNQLKKDYKSKTPILNIATTTFSFNISGLPQLINYCDLHHIKSISVSEGGYYNTPKVRHEQLIKHYPEEVKLAVNKAKEIAKNKGIILRLNSQILNSKIQDSINVKPIINKCINFYIYAAVNPLLEINSCALSYPIGSIDGTSLSNVWNGKNFGFVKARELLRKKNLPSTCRFCNDFNTRTLEDNQIFSCTTLQEELYN